MSKVRQTPRECEWVRVRWSESREGSGGEEGCGQGDVDTHQPTTSGRCFERLFAEQETGPRWLWLKKSNLQDCLVGITSDWVPLGTRLSCGQ